MEQETDRFKAVSDDGEEFTVIVYRTVTEERHLTGGSTRLGLPRLALADGSTVTPGDDPETFKIVQTHKIIRKVC